MRRLCIFFLFCILSTINLYADDLDKSMQNLLGDLASAYSDKKPLKANKYGIAILPFEEKSSAAASHSLGETVREALSRVTVRSNVFFLVDRETVSKSMEEIELSMTGAVNDSEVIKAGNLAGVNVFLRGTITEEAGKFIITARLIDVETGVVSAIAKAEIKTESLIEKQRQYAYEYISQYGLGINTQLSFAPHIKSPRDNAFTSIVDAFVNYRPYLWLNFKLGITYFNMNYMGEENGIAPQMYPLGTTHSTATNYSSFQTAEFHVKDAAISELGPFGGFDINWTPFQFLTVGFGFSMSSITPTILNVYNNGWVWLDNGGAGELYQINGFIIETHLEPIEMFRLEVKPQFFISPRFTVGLYLAYMYSTPLKVSRTTINSDYTTSYQFSPNNEMAAKYMGLTGETYGLNHNITDVKLNSMLYGISINFFF